MEDNVKLEPEAQYKCHSLPEKVLEYWDVLSVSWKPDFPCAARSFQDLSRCHAQSWVEPVNQWIGNSIQPVATSKNHWPSQEPIHWRYRFHLFLALKFPLKFLKFPLKQRFKKLGSSHVTDAAWLRFAGYASPSEEATWDRHSISVPIHDPYGWSSSQGLSWNYGEISIWKYDHENNIYIYISWSIGYPWSIGYVSWIMMKYDLSL